MVVFTCNHCGESLQKPKVEKHYFTACRRARKALTCVDCLKDFMDEDYVAHTKCVSEQERYAAKGSFTKAVVKKGEVKQESWTEVIQSVVENTTDIKPSQQQIVTFLANATNVPRKKNKFMNFVKNALSKKIPDHDIEGVWSIIEKYKGQAEQSTEAENQSEIIKEDLVIENGKESAKKKEKPKNLEVNTSENGVQDASKDIPKRKREKNVSEQVNITEEPLKKKMKKAKNVGENGKDDVHLNEATASENVTSDVQKEIQPSEKATQNGSQETVSNTDDKFSYEEEIVQILKIKNTMPVEKLQTKVLDAYHAKFGKKPTTKVTKKFKRHLKKIECIKISEDTVTLNNSSEIVTSDVQKEMEPPKKKKKNTQNGLQETVSNTDDKSSDVQKEMEPPKKKKKNTQNGLQETVSNTDDKSSDVQKEVEPPKKKKKNTQNGLQETVSNTDDQFCYDKEIIQILTIKKTMPLKKLLMKVLDAYHGEYGTEPTRKVMKKFRRHLKKIEGIEITEDTVTLNNS